MEQVLLDPGGRGLVTLPGRQLLAWPRSCREWEDYVCTWRLDWSVAGAALILGEWSARVLATDLWIISGGRTCQRQEELAREGRPAVSCETSCHVVGYPHARAFDVGYDFEPGTETRVAIADRALQLGLRSGLYFSSPSPNHFDAGPCP